MPLDPCTYANKKFGLSVVKNSSKSPVLLGVFSLNFDFFCIDQNLNRAPF